jgi:tetratricopeptide (TPR) repeat protein
MRAVGAALIVAAVAMAPDPAGQTGQEGSRAAAWRHVETWSTAIATHAPGRHDEAVRAMLDMRAQDLESAFPHMVLTLLRAVERDGRAVNFDTLFQSYLPSRSERAQFTLQERDAITRRGDALSADGVVRFLKRAAMLHADIALQAPDAHRTPRRGSGYLVNDGRSAGEEGRPWHWMLGRAFLHLVPDAGRDGDVRLWYQAVGTHLWSIRNFTEALPHVRRAVEIFPRDAEIQFQRGLVHESLGAPHIQSALPAQPMLRTATGTVVRSSPPVRARELEHRDARDAFAKAVDADPRHHEARIRLGRGLSLDGRHDRAATELRTALAGTSQRRLQYLAQLFLGRAEEARKRPGAAREAYEAAAALYPGAQSPRLALSQLALTGGDRARAAEMLEVLAARARADADPWWSYHSERVPGATAWSARMWAAFTEAMR